MNEMLGSHCFQASSSKYPKSNIFKKSSRRERKKAISNLVDEGTKFNKIYQGTKIK